MTIKLTNGSEIHVIDDNELNKRGYIRGRRLTDKEYKLMMFREYVMAEEKLNYAMTIAGLK